MKKYLFLFVIVIPIFVFAQVENESCTFIKAYNDTILENHDLRKKNSDLYGELNRLKNDSISNSRIIDKLMQDTAKLNQSLGETKLELSNTKQKLNGIRAQLSQCRKDSVQMKKQLRKCSPDSIEFKNMQITSLNDSIVSLRKLIENDEQEIQTQRYEIKKLDSVVAYLDNRFLTKSVDELYETFDRKELYMCVEIYRKLSKDLPQNIQYAISCFDAEGLTSEKYNKMRIDKAISKLPNNTKTGKKLVNCLQKYGTINSAANELWTEIKKRNKEISDDEFVQLQAKRQIWQITQEFLNQYPTLSTDYPYIAEQLQSMLREIWVNANNFNKIPNPFE